MIKKQRRAKIKQQLKEQKAKKVTNELKDGFVKMSEEQQDELAQAIADIVNEEENSEDGEKNWKMRNGKQATAGKHPITGEPLRWMFYDDYLKIKNEENDN